MNKDVLVAVISAAAAIIAAVLGFSAPVAHAARRGLKVIMPVLALPLISSCVAAFVSSQIIPPTSNRR